MDTVTITADQGAPGPMRPRAAADQSSEIDLLATALSKAQATMDVARKDSANPFFNSRYADLASNWDACRIPLTSNGLSVVQLTTGTTEEVVLLRTILLHSSGQFIASTLRLKPVKSDPQAIGSAITYARRYALQAIVGIAPDEDDDGNAASDKRPPAAGGKAAAAPPPRGQQQKPAAQAQQQKAQPQETLTQRVKRLQTESAEVVGEKPEDVLMPKEELKHFMAARGIKSTSGLKDVDVDIWERELQKRRADIAAAKAAQSQASGAPQ